MVLSAVTTLTADGPSTSSLRFHSKDNKLRRMRSCPQTIRALSHEPTRHRRHSHTEFMESTVEEAPAAC